MDGTLVSINVSEAREVTAGGRTYRTGIYKEPAAGRVPIVGVNALGDDQADRNAHGGPDRVLYAYASEDYAWWERELERPMPPGTFGENLTLRGIDVTHALVGERWQIGEVIVRVTSPRVPCFKLAGKMNDPHIIKRFADALRPGAYLALEQAGDVGAGDPARVIDRPSHSVTIEEFTRIFLFERERVGELLAAPELPESWRTWAEEQLV